MEFIFIDDGSEDDSFAVMKSLHDQDTRVRVFRFWRNAGKSPALAAGFAKAGGRIVITMDGDLQDDPTEIPALIEKLNEGYDIVSGWKKERKDPPVKLVLSWLFNSTVARCTGLPLHDVNCGLKGYRYEVVKTVRVYGEMHRFIPVLATKAGFRVTEIPVTHHPRTSGKSKYGMERVLRGLLDFSTILFFLGYDQRPAHLFGFLGLVGLVFGVLFTLTSIAALVMQAWFPGIVLLCFAAVSMGLGVSTILMGLLAELLTRNHYAHCDPYVINERLDASES